MSVCNNSAGNYEVNTFVVEQYHGPFLIFVVAACTAGQGAWSMIASFVGKIFLLTILFNSLSTVITSLSFKVNIATIYNVKTRPLCVC